MESFVTSVFPLKTAAAVSWQEQWNAVSKSNGSWKFDLLWWKFDMKKGSFDNFSIQSDMGDVLILFPYLHADWSHLKTQSFRNIGTSTEMLQTRSCFIWKVCRMSSLVFHSSGLISSSWFHVFIGRISWTYWNANSSFHIELKYRRVFFCMIDCIQATSKDTKKILSAVPLIPWHCQVLTFPVSNHWHRVIPEPALTSAFLPRNAHSAARCSWDRVWAHFVSTNTFFVVSLLLSQVLNVRNVIWWILPNCRCI